jgi:hypothetical protein
MYVQRDNEARLCNHCCSGKAKSITYSECASVVFGNQHVQRMSRIILPLVGCLALPYLFHTFS